MSSYAIKPKHNQMKLLFSFKRTYQDFIAYRYRNFHRIKFFVNLFRIRNQYELLGLLKLL